MSVADERDSTSLPVLHTLDEVADRLDVSPATLRRLVRERRIRHIKIGRKAPHFTSEHVAEIVQLFERKAVTRR